MATIKPIEGRSIHQIQSGQVIVDLCSVLKELVENSLDAAATSIDVRFKNNGLESAEVQDNGSGISRVDYETIALKHYTSKLSSYDDLSSLQTFGFRGEALSSLCALSDFHIVTAREDEAPKGTRLDFEASGKLRGTQVVASPKGTTVIVENLFKNLPVRRQELAKNIKREYSKVLGVLQAYACVSTNVRFSVSNVMAKGKKGNVFATKSNPTTRENIANVFGAKALSSLVAMDLKFDLQSSDISASDWSTNHERNKQVHVLGHVSRPILGEGRQTPDRQMFFVNSRPCGLPQVAKVINEVYKSYNISQSPFVFANLILDTNAYDVNVSPDKRTIFLHDQGALLDSFKTSLTELFENQQQTVPQTSRPIQTLPQYRALTISRSNLPVNTSETSSNLEDNRSSDAVDRADETVQEVGIQRTDSSNDGELENPSLIENFLRQNSRDRATSNIGNLKPARDENSLSADKQRLARKLAKQDSSNDAVDQYDDHHGVTEAEPLIRGPSVAVRDFNERIAEHQMGTRRGSSSVSASPEPEEGIQTLVAPAKHSQGVVPNAFERMRPNRTPLQTATIKIGSKTITSTIGSYSHRSSGNGETPSRPNKRLKAHNRPASQQFSNALRSFTAPGTQLASSEAESSDDGESPEVRLDHSANKGNGSFWAQELQLAAQDPEVENTSDGDQQTTREQNFDRILPLPCDHAPDSDTSGTEDSDSDYMNDEDKKAVEETRVAQLIRKAEEKLARPSEDNVRRATQLLQGGGRKDSTTQLIQHVETSLQNINHSIHTLRNSLQKSSQEGSPDELDTDLENESAENRLSLIVSKEDFARMRIIGQFNLGFIIAVRPAKAVPNSQSTSYAKDELFIIDQHASDEKYNFERLQSTTVVQNQRLVKPHRLDLTAVEEEVVLENQDVLLKNGFLIDIDESDSTPVGQRCSLLTLPMSREVTFDPRDLEELIAMLAESPPTTTTISSTNPNNNSNPHSKIPTNDIPRPSKVRKMFAMRACRSSVMIGKSLSTKQMQKLVKNMGEIDKPWNCPHGRPTMRHLFGLAGWEGWRGDVEDEGDGVDWGAWVEGMRGEKEEEEDE